MNFSEIRIVADMVSDPVLVHIAENLRLSRERFGDLEGLQDGGGVGLAAPEIVHLAGPWGINESGDEPGHVERVDVVPDLFALVAVDIVVPSLQVAFDEVAEEPVKLHARVVGPGEATAAQAAGGHAEVAPVFLDKHIARQL